MPYRFLVTAVLVLLAQGTIPTQAQSSKGSQANENHIDPADPKSSDLAAQLTEIKALLEAALAAQRLAPGDDFLQLRISALSSLMRTVLDKYVRTQSQEMMKQTTDTSIETSVTGAKLVSIRISGIGDDKQAMLLAVLPTHEGDIISDEMVRMIRRTVSGFDRTLKSHFTPEGDGVSLRIRP